MQRFILFALLLAASISPSTAAPRPKRDPNAAAQREAEFQQLFSTAFTAWDKNHDGKLDVKELKAAIEDTQVRNTQAAIACAFHRCLQSTNDDQPDSLTMEQVQSLAANRAVQRRLVANATHIVSMNRSLFLPSDPNLSAFHQGGLGDCYFLAPVGVFVNQHPLDLQKMIHYQNEGGYQIQFANGRIAAVPPLTDAEACMVESEHGEHGLWLAVLQKAYASILLETKLRKNQNAPDPDSSVATDIIGHGGNSGQIMTLLTGHQVSGTSLLRLLKKDPDTAADKMHALLTKLSDGHRTMVVYTSSDRTSPLPKSISHHHVIGVLGYDSNRRIVRLFNPWGNQVAPAGTPGLANGYPTQHGVFEVPLNDFLHLFTFLQYETEKTPIARPNLNTADSKP